MKKKVIELPRGYISYSQKKLWKSDPARYKQLYFDDRQELSFSNKAMEYGKVVADALEKGVDTGDLLTDSAMLLLPKYDVADQKFFAELKTKDGAVMIVAQPDSLNSETKDFFEFKTGTHKWTASSAQAHPQMIFYAMAVYLKWKVILKESALIWIETTRENGVVVPTGHVESFRVTFTLKQILEEMADTARVAKEISIAWAAHEPDPRLNW